MLVGQGIDAHRFSEDKKLILGGVEIEYELGMLAHSDGDVVLHALCDALLGAAGLGDIGRHFPDNDDQYKGIDSRVLLRDVVQKLNDDQLTVNNADLTIVAQKPKLAPYIEVMQRNIAQDLQIEPRRVNVKATTTEKMGFAGRGEGIAAFAVVLLNE